MITVVIVYTSLLCCCIKCTSTYGFQIIQQRQRGQVIIVPDNNNNNNNRRKYQQKWTTTTTSSSSSSSSNLYLSSSFFEYEYIPFDENDNSNNDNNNNNKYVIENQLYSTYNDLTPAGLRGEAVRSALRYKCIGWNFNNSINHNNNNNCNNNYNTCIIQIAGNGTINFLNNKFTEIFEYNDDNNNNNVNKFQQACLLTSKGKLIDIIHIAYKNNIAYLVTSPGHINLYNRLNPYIFPMDQIIIKDISNNNYYQFTLASVNQTYIQDCFNRYIIPYININNNEQEQQQSIQLQLPDRDHYLQFKLSNDNNDSILLILPTCYLPNCACYGYTFCFINDSNKIGQYIWDNQLLQKQEVATTTTTTTITQSPPVIEIGTLEYETLRIETGQPLYGKEYTAGLIRKNNKDNNQDDESKSNNNTTTLITPTSPLELHIPVNINKGCYLGQEGIISIMKNKRGPPRTLYHVIFEDEYNLYNIDNNNKRKFQKENLTRIPKSGDQLYVLGSNEKINIGIITSIAEPSGTGESIIIGLALIKRSDSIRKQMKEYNISIPSKSIISIDNNDKDNIGSGIIEPPSLDPLDGLEVIIGGTYTIGKLQVIPSQQRNKKSKQMMFVDDIPEYVQNLPPDNPYYYSNNDDSKIRTGGKVIEVMTDDQSFFDTMPQSSMDAVDTTSTPDLNIAVPYKSDEVRTTKTDDDDDEAAKKAAEAKRKEEKMELLRKRAEEAIARRRKKNKNKDLGTVTADDDDDDEARAQAEAKRKAEKMELLRKQAEEAIARRRKNKE